MKLSYQEIDRYACIDHPILYGSMLWTYLISSFIIGTPLLAFGQIPQSIKVLTGGVLVLLCLVTIAFLFNKFRWQTWYPLLLGIHCLVLSGLFLIAANQFVLITDESYTSFFQLLSTSLFMTTIAGFNLFIRHLVHKGFFSSLRKKKPKGINYGIISICSALGLFIGRIALKDIQDQYVGWIMVASLLVLSIAFSLGTHNIYKHFIIKAYQSDVKLHMEQPTKTYKRRASKV